MLDAVDTQVTAHAGTGLGRGPMDLGRARPLTWPQAHGATAVRPPMHKHIKPKDHRVVVLGASPKPSRYSFHAVALLARGGYQVIPVHPKAHRIEQIPVVASLRDVPQPVHTLTLYLGKERSKDMIDDILALGPGRVIFNPGSESHQLEHALTSARIPHERACTLVLLRTGQF